MKINATGFYFCLPTNQSCIVKFFEYILVSIGRSHFGSKSSTYLDQTRPNTISEKRNRTYNHAYVTETHPDIQKNHHSQQKSAHIQMWMRNVEQFPRLPRTRVIQRKNTNNKSKSTSPFNQRSNHMSTLYLYEL